VTPEEVARFKFRIFIVLAMKVVLVSRFPSDIDQPRGGVETATVGLAKALFSLGITDLHIVTIEKHIAETSIENHEGLTVHRLPRSRWPMILDAIVGPSVRILNRYLRQLEPTVVHYHETWGFSAPKCGFPAVFTVHGFDSLNLPTEKAPFWRTRSKLWDWSESIGLRKQKHIISIAPYVHHAISTKTNAKISDIWNSLNPLAYAVSRKEKRGSLLFLGWLNPRKNPLVIVKAAAKLIKKHPDLKVRLCGEASVPHYFKELQDAISDFGLTKCVEMPGRLNQSAVRKELSTAALLVLPSFQENAPMVIAEAMAAGIPIVASNLCGIPDMVEDGKSGLLLNDPTDADELVNTLDKLLSNDELRHCQGESAKYRAEQLFHPTSVASQTIEVYKQAVFDYSSKV
jgi:glycosyltransferase involved in cell wall biosynthesis